MASANSRQPLGAAIEQRAADDRQPIPNRHERQLQLALAQIEEALQGLRFGQVTITVQDGVVVQIDRLEKTRLPRTPE